MPAAVTLIPAVAAIVLQANVPPEPVAESVTVGTVQVIAAPLEAMMPVTGGVMFAPIVIDLLVVQPFVALVTVTV